MSWRPSLQQASLQAQVDATRQLIEINAKMVQILTDRQTKGYASGLDLAAQQSQLAQVSATLPPLKQKLPRNSVTSSCRFWRASFL